MSRRPTQVHALAARARAEKLIVKQGKSYRLPEPAASTAYASIQWRSPIPVGLLGPRSIEARPSSKIAPWGNLLRRTAAAREVAKPDADIWSAVSRDGGRKASGPSPSEATQRPPQFLRVSHRPGLFDHAMR